jgi:ferredoxin
MKEVQFRGGASVQIKTHLRVLDAMLAKEIDVMMLCGGQGLCATCHIYVTKNPHCLTPATEQEKKTLALLTGAQPNSRLACQARVISEGLEVDLPEGLYVQSLTEIEALIGKRSEVPVVHPVDGRVLIQAGKIITRSAIMQLNNMTFDLNTVKIKEA